jgi:hypothetical protein
MATDTGFGKVKRFEDWTVVENDATNSTHEVGTSATIAVNIQNNGALVLTTHTDDNDSARVSFPLNWNPSHGLCVMEARVTQVTDNEGRGIFIGWTDDATTEENPISLSGTTFTTTASNAVGFVFDTDATTDVIYCKGVKSDTDSATITTAKTLAAAGTWQTFRVAVDVEGNAVFSINGEEVGRLSNAITPNTDICPTVLLKNSDAAAASMYVDYLYAEGSRE